MLMKQHGANRKEIFNIFNDWVLQLIMTITTRIRSKNIPTLVIRSLIDLDTLSVFRCSHFFFSFLATPQRTDTRHIAAPHWYEVCFRILLCIYPPSVFVFLFIPYFNDILKLCIVTSLPHPLPNSSCNPIVTL